MQEYGCFHKIYQFGYPFVCISIYNFVPLHANTMQFAEKNNIQAHVYKQHCYNN